MVRFYHFVTIWHFPFVGGWFVRCGAPCWWHSVCSVVQGHCWSGALSDYYQAVLQAGTGDVHQGKLVLHCSVTSLIVLLVQGIVFVYDITNGPSFQHLAKWVSDVDEVRAHTLSRPSFSWPHGGMLMFRALPIQCWYRSDIGLISVWYLPKTECWIISDFI